MKKETNRLAENFSGVSLCLFALPAMVMMVFQGLYTIVDTVFVARFVNRLYQKAAAFKQPADRFL